MTCNNSSNINLVKTFVSVTNGGSRLMINIPDSKCATGITYGSVIRYDPTANSNIGQYRLSNASTILTSEVIGIVESINTDKSKNVVVYGSVNLPASAIEDIPIGFDGGSGGSDVYFLSPTSSGKLRNSAPDDINHVVKAVYQKAPHGNGSYTGIVVNYVGYKINGTDIGSSSYNYSITQNAVGDNNYNPDTDEGIGLLKFMLLKTDDIADIPDTFVDCSISHLLNVTDYPDYFNTYGYYYPVYSLGRPVSSLPAIYRTFVELCNVNTQQHTVNSSHINKYIFRRNSTEYAQIIDWDPVNNAYIVSHDTTTSSAFVCRTSTEQPTYEYGISNTIGGTLTAGVSYFKFTTINPYGMWTPRIDYTGAIASRTQVVNARVLVMMKVKKGVQSGAADVQNNTFRATSLRINNEDINLIVSDLQNRIQQLETRLLI
jgi:hypothetical protein